MKDTKIVAMYLPQYHEIEENNLFWGKGFTDWTTVKSAKRYFKDQLQPKVPLNDNYYDLSNEDVIKWQTMLAKEYGVDAFCFYHYWFSSKKNLMTTPPEIFLKNKDLPLQFCFAWDNAPWKRTWSTQYGNAWAPIGDQKLTPDGKEILIDFDYEDEIGWKNHFEYLLPFFLDSRYLKIDNKPVFLILNYYQSEVLKKMRDYWNNLAKDNNFSGIYIIGRCDQRRREKIFDSEFLYQPVFSGWQNLSVMERISTKLINILAHRKVKVIYDYEHIWKRVVHMAKKSKYKNNFYGAFIDYDDTPRRGELGKYCKNVSVMIFRKYFQELLNYSRENNKDFLFLTAWNEWGEGAFLEPDVEKKYEFLTAIKEIVTSK